MAAELGTQLGEAVLKILDSGLAKIKEPVFLTDTLTVVCPRQKKMFEGFPVPTKEFVSVPDGETETEVSFLQLAEDFLMIGVKPELNYVTAQEILRRFPCRNTLVVQMINGAEKYMADRESFHRMTYEAMNGFFGCGAAERLAEKIGEYGELRKKREERKMTGSEEKLERLKRFVPEPEKATGGDSNRITREYLDRLLIEYRHIGGTKPSLKFELFGRTFDTPIMLGGMAAMVPGLHEGGMAEMARGVKNAGGVFWSGYIHDEEFAEAVHTGVGAIRIIKPLRDNEEILRAIRHDEACGSLAFAMDIDHGFDDFGEYHHAVPHAYGELGPKSVEELKRFVESTSLPFIAKGVLSVRDARLCVEAGARGLLLSHHKGEYRFAVPPLMVLPEIRAAVGPDIRIFVDCGIQSGMDAFKALALGADGVCVARPFMKPFAENGAAGVQEKLEQMTKELAGVMAKTCSPDIGSIDPTVIRRL